MHTILRFALLGPILVCAVGCGGLPVDLSLFDGRTLAGWTTTGGRYDGTAVWLVEDGAITGRRDAHGGGGLIYTRKSYADFELELDARVSYPFDSGIFLRMTPDAKGSQITIDNRPGGEIGGIYSDGFYWHNPSGMERYRQGEWNHFRVRCTGDPMHVEAWMNGEPLVDYIYPADTPGFAPEGLIGLQVHGAADAAPDSSAQFKNITVRELERPELFTTDDRGVSQVTEAGRDAGWAALFDGETLNGWEPNGTGYEVVDGEIQFLWDGTSHELRSVTDHQDFHLKLDFQIERGANSGVFLRADRTQGNPAYSGREVQVIDDFHWNEDTHSTLAPWQYSGSLYGAVEPGVKDALRPLGEWNTYEIRLQGSWMQTVLNGHVLYTVDTFTLNDAQPLFVDRVSTGFIGLQRHAPARASDGPAYAAYRNVFVRDLREGDRP
tara:strand:+ start:2614 stop:3924 length:1311 start_codon:yes stop_codon:yes gene_type:complete